MPWMDEGCGNHYRVNIIYCISPSREKIHRCDAGMVYLPSWASVPGLERDPLRRQRWLLVKGFHEISSRGCRKVCKFHNLLCPHLLHSTYFLTCILARHQRRHSARVLISVKRVINASGKVGVRFPPETETFERAQVLRPALDPPLFLGWNEEKSRERQRGSMVWRLVGARLGVIETSGLIFDICCWHHNGNL